MTTWTQRRIKIKVDQLVAAAAESLRLGDAQRRIAADPERPAWERDSARQAAAHFDVHRAGCLAHADALDAGADPESLGY